MQLSVSSLTSPKNLLQLESIRCRLSLLSTFSSIGEGASCSKLQGSGCQKLWKAPGFWFQGFFCCGRILSNATRKHTEGNAGQPAFAEAGTFLSFILNTPLIFDIYHKTCSL